MLDCYSTYTVKSHAPTATANMTSIHFQENCSWTSFLSLLSSKRPTLSPLPVFAFICATDFFCVFLLLYFLLLMMVYTSFVSAFTMISQKPPKNKRLILAFCCGCCIIVRHGFRHAISAPRWWGAIKTVGR